MAEKKKVVIPIGPYHPLQEEPEAFRLYVEGERVVDIEFVIGYVHRGIEKLSESKHFEQVPYLVERICGICSTSHPFAYVNAVEDLARIEVPERALFIRTLTAEMERIHSHLLWLGLAGHFVGYNTVWMWAWRYREPILDMFEMFSGNRNHYGMMKIGGIKHDFRKEYTEPLRRTLEELEGAVKMFKGAVLDDPVLKARLKNVGVLTRDEAVDWCVVGPTARASGIDIDVRRDDPYAVYDRVEWNVILQEEGDVFAKTVVRLLEMEESIKIIRQCLEQMPEGEIDAGVKDIPPGEGIGRVEAPRGECFHYVRGDGANRPVRHKVRAPSYMNVASNKVGAVGGTVSDAAITLAAVDPCYCCTERTCVIDAATDARIMTGKDLVRLSQEKTEAIKERLNNR